MHRTDDDPLVFDVVYVGVHTCSDRSASLNEQVLLRSQLTASPQQSQINPQLSELDHSSATATCTTSSSVVVDDQDHQVVTSAAAAASCYLSVDDMLDLDEDGEVWTTTTDEATGWDDGESIGDVSDMDFSDTVY